MSDKRARKQQKREQKKRDRAKKDAAYAKRMEGVRIDCPDCGETCRTDQTTFLHRKGPCGCDRVAASRIDDLLEERRDLYEELENKFVPCANPKCGRKIKIEAERYVRCEGKLLWLGCDACFKVEEPEIDKRLDEIRGAWPEIVALKAEAQHALDEIKARAEAEAQRCYERYVAPLAKPPEPIATIGAPPEDFKDFRNIRSVTIPRSENTPDKVTITVPPEDVHQKCNVLPGTGETKPEDPPRFVPFPTKESIFSRAMAKPEGQA